MLEEGKEKEITDQEGVIETETETETEIHHGLVEVVIDEEDN
jgi:hypothetical protein